ncbi:hypothetical protein ACFYYR_31230 [Streptomyces sp. NPDC001922]|uniref:hypothetical protein n=1 Tax=Streptomyces sp. NPDC001922 TaxID=3364624 RepID=UPI0036AFF54D
MASENGSHEESGQAGQRKTAIVVGTRAAEAAGKVVNVGKVVLQAVSALGAGLRVWDFLTRHWF